MWVCVLTAELDGVCDGEEQRDEEGEEGEGEAAELPGRVHAVFLWTPSVHGIGSALLIECRGKCTEWETVATPTVCGAAEHASKLKMLSSPAVAWLWMGEAR